MVGQFDNSSKNSLGQDYGKTEAIAEILLSCDESSNCSLLWRAETPAHYFGPRDNAKIYIGDTICTAKYHHQVFDQQMVVPKRHAILCGSGHAVFNHLGNMLFRSIAENKAVDYANAVTRAAKSMITSCILVQVQSTSARVLEKDPIRPLRSAVVGEKRDKVLRDKTTHYLRAFLTTRRRSVGATPPPAPQRPVSDERLQEEQQEEDNKLSMTLLHILFSFRPSLLSSTHFADVALPFLQYQSSNVLSTEEGKQDDGPSSAYCSHSIERGHDASTIMVRTIQEMQESPLQLVPACSLAVSFGSLFTFMLEDSSILKSTYSGESSPVVFDAHDPFVFSS